MSSVNDETLYTFSKFLHVKYSNNIMGKIHFHENAGGGRVVGKPYSSD
jgi:hypothetical protein